MAETRKSIVFQARFDMSELPQAVKSMQRQMEQMNTGTRMAQQGMGGVIPKPDDIQKSKTALMQFIREQAQQQERLLGLINKQADKVSMLSNIDKNSLKDEKEKENVINRQIRAKERLLGLESAYDSRQKVLGQALDVSGGGQLGGGKTVNELLSGAAKRFVMPAVVSAIVGATAKAITQYAALPREIMTATGAATQGLIGTPLQNVQTDLIKTMAFKKEWGESLSLASQERERANFLGAARLFSAKGLVGRFGSDLSGIMDFISPGTGSATVGRLVNPYEQGYQAEQTQMQAQRAQEVYAAKLQSDPAKMAAINKFSQNYMRDLAAQRAMGLSDDQYYGRGGFQERFNKGGFNEELGLGMAGQIQSAGGSTRGAAGLSLLGLQAQRGLDLTNAGSILGKISGTAGGAGASEQIFRKLMEESVRAGLDKSEFREEQRRFTDAASDILAGTGVKTAADAAMVLSGFTKFLGGESTVRGIQGAVGAFEQVQGLTSQTSGRGGAMQMASFMRNPRLRRLGAAGYGELMRMPEKDMVASNEDIIGAAAEIGMAPEKLATTLKQMKRNDMLLTLGLDPMEIKEFADSEEGKAFRASGGRSTGMLSRKHLAVWRKIQKQTQFGTDYNGPQEQAALNLGILGGEGGPSTGLGAIPGASRRADITVAASGQVAQEFLENFREFSKAITPSTEAVADWTKQLIMSATVLRYTAAGNQAAALKALSEANAKNATNGGQPQVTTPSSE